MQEKVKSHKNKLDGYEIWFSLDNFHDKLPKRMPISKNWPYSQIFSYASYFLKIKIE